MTLTISQLFNPTPSGVAPGVTPATVATGTWLYTLLSNAATLGLPTTAWQSGGITWTTDQMLASVLAGLDGGASLRAQGSLLDFAATGTVTYQDPRDPTGATLITIPVTPDPSIPGQNPTAAPGWLDALASSRYNTTRTPATYASQNEYLVNFSGVSGGTFNPGTYHVYNPISGATYNNSSTFTFGASTIAGTSISSVATGLNPLVTTSSNHGLSTGARVYIFNVPGLNIPWATITVTGVTTFTLNGISNGIAYTSGGLVYLPQSVAFVADLIGPGSNSGVGQVASSSTSIPGTSVYNFDNFTGSPWQSNVSLAAQCRSQLQAVSPNGAKGAYDVYAKTAGTILAAQSPPKTLTSAITRTSVYTQTATGAVEVVVANASGPVPGATNLLVTNATNASPIVVTVSSTSGLSVGMHVLVSGVVGNTAANGYFTIGAVTFTGTTFSLDGSVGNGAYVNGGVVEAGDLGLVDSVIQAYSDPNGVTAQTFSASALTVDVSANVWVPNAFLADYGTNPAVNKGATALSTLFPTIPLGGTRFPIFAFGLLDSSQVQQAIFNAGATTGGPVYTLDVDAVTLNGSFLSLPMATVQVAVLGTVNLVVRGA